LLAFILVSVHEMDRIALWMEGVCLEWGAAPEVLAACEWTREATAEIGISGLNRAENRLLAYAANLPRIGEIGIGGNGDADATPTGADEAPNRTFLPGSPPDPGPEEPGPVVSESGNTVTSAASATKPPVVVAALAVPLQEKLKPKTVLVAGDSMILEGFGPALQRALKGYPGLKVAREGKYSSGLSRPDYFNWHQYMNQILDQHNPDVLVMTLGANDPQDIVDAERKRHFTASETWNEIYAQRAGELIAIPQERGIRTFWVSLPIMGPDKYNERIKNLNNVVQAVCEANSSCTWIDTWGVLVDDKNQYTTFMKDAQGKHVRIRAKDNIHLTDAGGDILVAYFLEQVKDLIEWPAAEEEAVPADPDAVIENGRSPFYNPDGSLKTPARGAKVLLGSVESKSPARTTSYFAFVPEFEPGQGPDKFPVLYLLHGQDQDYAAWKDNAQMALTALVQKYGIVIVTPDGGRFGWYADSPVDPANRNESGLIGETIPTVEGFLPIIPGARSIAGVSMGGHGAFVLALRHPDVFRSFSAMSGVMDLTRHADKWELPAVFGPLETKRDLWLEHSALHLVETRKEALSRLPFMFGCGVGDEIVLEENRAMAKKLEEIGLRPDYRENPGGHDWEFWKNRLPEQAAFHARILNGAPVVSTVGPASGTETATGKQAATEVEGR
jgi:S-formylglutathione hydrolase FrmB